MATEKQVAVTQQQKTVVYLPKAGKAKNGAPRPDEKNRRALGDIGNVIEIKAQNLIAHRPITRSFGSQLLADSQAAVFEKKEKQAVNLKGDSAAAEEASIGETQPKAAADNPKPIVVIEISPDTNESINKRKFKKKKVHTMSSVLSARSKTACETPKDHSVPDIDASDVDNQLAVVDYVEDLYKFYKLTENSNKPLNYIDSQAEINENMRALLGDWLLEVHHKFELMPETLYLTFCIMDKYLSVEKVKRREFQLVGVSSMLIASKYEEIWAPPVEEFVTITNRGYNQEQILHMEKAILNKLEWRLTVPTPYVFLLRFIKAAMDDKEMEHMVYFLAELGLLQYTVMMKYCPSMVAASAVYAARCTLNRSPLWSESLKWHTGFCEEQLMDCAKILVRSHMAAPGSKLKAVFKKYSSIKFGAVALHSPAKSMLEKDERVIHVE